MSYIGDIRLGDTFDTKFVTTAATTGAPTTLAGTPVISAYVGNSVTQITAGITLTVDFDAVAGLHNVRVVASGANGFATASNYQLVITTGTVGGTSAVGYVVAEFSIEARSAIMPTTAARTLDVSATGEAGLDWANIGAPTTAQNLSATNIDVDQIVASVSGAVGSVTGAVGSVTGLTAATVHSDLDDIQARLPAALTAGGNIKADALAWNGLATVALPATPTNITAATGIVLSGVTHTGAVIPTVSAVTGLTAATVHSDLDDIQARLPAALVGGRMDASVGAVAANAITAAAIADGAIDRATFAADTGLQTIRSGTAQAGAATTITLDAGASAVDSFYNNALVFLTGGTGVGQARFVSAYVGATKVATVAAWATNPDATSTFAVMPFDAVAGSSAPTAAQNATAVWDKARSAHVTAGTFGEGAASVQGNVTGSVGSVTGAVGSVTGSVGSVTGSVGSVTGAVGSVTGLTASNLDATVSSRATPAQILTTALTESYAADGAAPTVAQALFHILGREYEFAISGDTLTVKKLDGLTTAMTFTLAPAGGPFTSITRAT